MNIATPKFGVGASALRKEDPKLVRGEGAFTDDIRAEGELRGFVLRSPHAAARFVINDIDAARASDGVHLVLTAADVAHLGPVMCPGARQAARRDAACAQAHAASVPQ